MRTAFKNKNNIYKNQGIVLINSETFTIVNSYAVVPNLLYRNIESGIYLIFAQPSVVTLNWGDGTSEIYNTFVNDLGEQEFSIRDREVLMTKFSTKNRYTGGNKDRIMTINFDKKLLVSINLSQILLKKQIFNFSLSEYPNLKRLSLSYLLDTTQNFLTGGIIKKFNFGNFDKSNIEDLTMASCFSNDEIYNRTIPLDIFKLPLKKLSLGGDYGNLSFSESNLNKIGTSFRDTLTHLSLSYNGGIPENITLLKKLKYFGFRNVQNINWTEVPKVVEAINWIEELELFNLIGLVNLNINFSNFSKLTKINFNLTIAQINDFDWINTLPTSVRIMELTSFSSSKIDVCVTKLYYKIISNRAYSGMYIDFREIDSMSYTPSGVYQQPIKAGDPQSPLEMIWELNNVYSCDVKFEL